MKTAIAALFPLLAVTLAGCLEHPITHVEVCKFENAEVPLVLDEGGDVDILFVIDNSGSMADEQARLAGNFEAFAQRLDEIGAHYRIGFTTTDAGNPRCKSAETTPENGGLVLQSCLDRLDEGAFQFDKVDASFACTEVCGLSGDELAITPTTTDVDGERRSRPWIEKIDGETNLPAGVAMADAFACFGPQGINGCAHEQPLEAMHLALTKALSPKDGNYGFMREGALLSVIVVTDEADCSFEPAHKDIFLTDNTTFWEDKAAPFPTSAVCWNAGVVCEGPGPVYEGCEPEDFTAEGQPGAAEGEAVLRPISRYIDLLDQIRRDKQALDPTRDVLLSLIAGVPAGYESGTAEIPYAEAAVGSDQDRLFGIGAGCVSSDGKSSTAVPPVRERVVAEAFSGGERNLYSICEDDFTPALEGIARQIVRAIPPVCGKTIVADQDPETEALDPECKIQQVADGVTTDVLACVPAGADGWAVPEGSSVCAVVFTDPGGLTETKRDDMTQVADEATGEVAVKCDNDETNVEFKLLRAGPRVRGATYTATCLTDVAERCE